MERYAAHIRKGDNLLAEKKPGRTSILAVVAIVAIVLIAVIAYSAYSSGHRSDLPPITTTNASYTVSLTYDWNSNPNSTASLSDGNATTYVNQTNGPVSTIQVQAEGAVLPWNKMMEFSVFINGYIASNLVPKTVEFATNDFGSTGSGMIGASIVPTISESDAQNVNTKVNPSQFAYSDHDGFAGIGAFSINATIIRNVSNMSGIFHFSWINYVVMSYSGLSTGLYEMHFLAYLSGLGKSVSCEVTYNINSTYG